MLEDALARLGGEVEAGAVVLEQIDDPQRLLVVAEAVGEERRELLLAGVAERRVAEVVAEADGLREVFVQVQRAGDGPGDLHPDGR